MKRTAFGLLVIGVCSGMSLSPVAAAEILDGIKGADDRLTMVSDEYPWSAVGRINTETGGQLYGCHCGACAGVDGGALFL